MRVYFLTVKIHLGWRYWILRIDYKIVLDKKIIVASKASDPISKTIQSHTPRASFASVIFPVKWGRVGENLGAATEGIS